MKTKYRHAALFFLLMLLALFGTATIVSAQETGMFVLYKYQKSMGTETYAITKKDGVVNLSTEFQLKFIGSGFSLDTTLKLNEKDLTPLYFETKGMTSTRTRVDAKVEVSEKGTATITNFGEVSTHTPRGRFFTVFQPAPVSPQMMLFRYWKRNKIKNAIPLLPGGSAKIEYLGSDEIGVSGTKWKLKRYAIDGVMWGREIAWFDKDDRLIALVSADAEMDRFEAVREGFGDSLEYFVKTAAGDAVNQLKNISRKIKPIYQDKFALVGGTLVGGTDFATVSDSIILVKNGKILSVGKRSETKVPDDFPVFDATGKTILPGFFDMHAHATQAEWFPASLAAGITTMRDAANELEFIVPIRDAEKSGEITVSPRLILAGYIDSGPSSVGKMKAETPAEARAIVRKYKRAGFEQIKIYHSLKKELIKVVTEEAHKLDMTVTGHIPRGVSIWDAVEDGYDQVNHLGFVFPIMTSRTPGAERNFDPASKAALAGFRFLKENRIVVEPTLARGENSSKVFGDSFSSTEPGVKKAPFEFQALIKSMGVPAESAARRQRGRAFGLQVLKALHEAGIPLVVGTDLVVPGHTEFREIELFVAAGLSPIDAIKAATIVPARAMKVDSKLGTIEEGKLADLAVVDGNPLESISEIRNVRYVIKGGKMFNTGPLWRSVGFQP
ncbi:MAG: amidohydrolase family protein [Pyrinomonadaceae bacterium]|nr:amidohydrolase family protein [Pyrinomonadaceae bacterium]